MRKIVWSGVLLALCLTAAPVGAQARVEVRRQATRERVERVRPEAARMARMARIARVQRIHRVHRLQRIQRVPERIARSLDRVWERLTLRRHAIRRELIRRWR
jgi:hypothetical protein